VVTSFADYFHRPPDQLGPSQIRSYLVCLLKERKIGVRTVGHNTEGIRWPFPAAAEAILHNDDGLNRDPPIYV